MAKKISFILLVLLLVYLAIFPRITEVVSGNFVFILDQGRDYMELRKIAIDHKPTLIGSEIGGGMAGFQGIFQGPFHFYFLTIPFILFDGDPYGGVVLMFLFGIVTIYMGFILGRKVFGTWGGLLVALAIATSPPLIAQSRFVWNPYPSSLFILLAFYFIYRISQENRVGRDIFFAAFFTGFIYNFEIATSIPMSIALFLYIIFVLRIRSLREYVFLFSGFFIAYSPFFLFEIRHGFNAFKGAFAYLFAPTNMREGEPFMYNQSGAFLINIIDTFPHFFQMTKNLFIFLFGFAVLFSFIREKNVALRRFLLFFLFQVVMTVIILSFLRNHVFMYYLIHFNMVYLFLFVYILTTSIRQRVYPLVLLISGIGLFFLFDATANAWHVFSSDVKDYGGAAKIKGKLDAIDYIYKDAKGKPFGLFVFAPSVYTYPYDYLVLWHGQKTYGYIPHTKKKDTFYLLIEQDQSAPWTYKGWLETVIKTGDVLKTEELQSGLIVQKRVANENIAK